MPTITGTLSDIGLAPLTALQPKLQFRPSNPAVDNTGKVVVTRPVEVTPTTAGAFSVELAPTENLLPQRTHVVVSVRWLDAAGWNELPLRLYIGTSNATITDVLEYVPNDLVFTGTNVPVAGRPEKFQFDPVTGDLFERKA